MRIGSIYVAMSAMAPSHHPRPPQKAVKVLEREVVELSFRDRRSDSQYLDKGFSRTLSISVYHASIVCFPANFIAL